MLIEIRFRSLLLGHVTTLMSVKLKFVEKIMLKKIMTCIVRDLVKKLPLQTHWV